MKIELKYGLSLFLFFFTLSSGPGLNAQEISFKASAPSTVTLGQGFNFTITGNENVKSSSIQLPEADGIRFVSGPATFVSTQSSIINGKRENITQVTFTYVLVATKEGKITIPPVTIKTGKKTFSTEAVDINVIPSSPAQSSQPETSKQDASSAQTPAGDNYFIRLIPSKRSVWLGEELLLSAKIYTNENLRFSEIKYPEFEGFWKQEIEADQQASREMIEGSQYLTQVFKRDLLIPQKTGVNTINPVDATVLVQQRVRTQRRSPFGDIFNDPFFNDQFFDTYQNVPVDIKSNALSIEVKPLPSGAPVNFTGAVGQFTLDVTPLKDLVNVNEAISFKINVKGKGNLALLKAPRVNFPPDVEVFEPKTAKNISHSVNGTYGTVSFEYVLIPRYPGSFRIAPVEFPFFNPAKGSYQILKTKDITIKVEKSESAEQAEILGMQPGMTGIRQDQVASINTDILFIKTNTPLFRQSGKNLPDSKFFKWIFPCGVILFILLLIVQRERIRRNQDLSWVRTRQARKIAVKRLKTAKKRLQKNDAAMYEEILKSLWGYIGDKLSMDQANLSRLSVQAVLKSRNVPENVITAFLEIIDDCELARYAAETPLNPENVYQRSEDLLYKLESSIS